MCDKNPQNGESGLEPERQANENRTVSVSAPPLRCTNAIDGCVSSLSERDDYVLCWSARRTRRARELAHRLYTEDNSFWQLRTDTGAHAPDHTATALRTQADVWA